MTDIAVFHYHLLAGGVTNVIYLSVIALLRNISDISSLTLVCGNNENTSFLMEKFKKEIPELAQKIKIDVIPELDYTVEQNTSGHKYLKSILNEKYKNKIWLVHNYQLGKNPFFTRAVLETADDNPDQKIILYIHDFPECSRYKNLQYLLKFVNIPVYPVKNNVRYLVINGRDRDLLVNAGLPKTHVFLVNNPVEKYRENIQRKKIRLAEKLSVFSDGEYGSLNNDGPVFLYPVRMIRRKNILEACALTSLYGDNANLVVTLPGLSDQEKLYSHLIEKAFTKNLVSGYCGIGKYLDKTGLSYFELFENSDMIISSSVQEGFGYLFIDSVQHRVPLFARYLDIISGFRHIFPEQSSYFYKEFEVPVSLEEMTVIRKNYYTKINKIKSYLTDKLIAEQLFASVDKLSSQRFLDFSRLSADHQYRILETIKSSAEYKNELLSINGNLLESMRKVYNSKVPDVDIETIFGYRKYALNLAAIFESFSLPGDSLPEPGHEVQKKLLGSFASLDYLRLIYNDFH